MGDVESLLVLGAGLDQCFMIRTAKEMGLRVLAVDENELAPGFNLADVKIVLSNRDVESICAFLESSDERVSGVSTMGSDIPHIVSAVAERLHLPSISLSAANKVVNKYKMKELFRKHNIFVPDYYLIKSYSEFLSLLEKWKCLVIKPLSQAGSRGVFLIDLADTRKKKYFDETQSYSADGDVLVERYIAGPQLSSESLIVDGKVYTPGYADRNYKDLNFFLPQIMENGGWVPSLYEHRRADVDKIIDRCAKALGIKNGVIKGDLIFLDDGRIAVVEVAARLSGGDFCESLAPLSHGLNYVTDVINLAIGRKVKFDDLDFSPKLSVANRYFFPCPGELLRVEGVDHVKSLPYVKKIEIWVKPGDIISKANAHGQRGGVFVVTGKDREEVQKNIDYVYRNIEFKLAS